MKNKIIMLVGKDSSSNIMYNSLKEDFDIEKVIIEDGISKKVLLKNRIKRLGLSKVIGQILFILFDKVYLTKSSSRHIESLKQKLQLDESEYDSSILQYVKSVNSDETLELIKSIDPDVVVVNGTRIISEKILSSTKATFINTHMGITPKYRGTHGGYWALTQKDPENCGVTVHLVDKGIDTGGILYQDSIKIDKNDSYNSYPYHLIAKARPLMKSAINDVINDDIKIKYRKDINSMIWSHPTIIEYIKYRFDGVK